MAATDDIPRSWSLLSLAALTAIVVAPPWLMIGIGGASWSIVAAGAAIWAASVLAKRALVRGGRRLVPGWPGTATTAAVLQGGVSAVTELAPAAAYLTTLRSASLSEVLAFGIGAGAAEAAYVLALGIWKPQVDPDELLAWIEGAGVSWCVRYSVPIERLFALIGHVGARGLLYVALMHSGPFGVLWALAAITLFAAIDGVAVYGHLQRWQWSDPRVCRRAHSYFAALSVTELILLLFAFQQPG
jgi:hypothetical protein